jgi:hypothetical protein
MKELRFCVFILTFASCSVGDISSESNNQSIESPGAPVPHNLSPIDSAQQIKINKGNQNNSIINPSKSKRKKGL